MGKALINSKADAHSRMCSSTMAALEKCFAKEGTSMKEATTFPESCADVAVDHMECALMKKDYAYQIAESLAGKDAVAKVFPQYKDSKQKALDLIEIYKNNAAGGKLKKDTFWG